MWTLPPIREIDSSVKCYFIAAFIVRARWLHVMPIHSGREIIPFTPRRLAEKKEILVGCLTHVLQMRKDLFIVRIKRLRV